MNDHLDDTDTIITSSDITFPNITVTTTGSGNAFTAASASGHALTFTKGTTFSTTDTKNTAGATTSTSKMYLIGATATGANPQTYCNTSVYATNGTLHATNLEGAGTNITGLVETGTTAISSYTGSALIYILKDSSGNVTDIYVKQ